MVTAPRRASSPGRFYAAVLLVVIMLTSAGCARSIDPSSLGADGQRLLSFVQSADEVQAALSAAAEAGEPDGDAWDRARSLLDVLAADAAGLPAQEATVTDAATFFIDAGSIMLGFLQNSDPNRAKAFFEDRVTTNHQALGQAVDRRLEALGGSPVGGSSNVPVALLVGVLAVVAVAIFLFRQAQVGSSVERDDPAPAPTPAVVPAGAPAPLEPATEVQPAPETAPAARPVLTEPNHNRLRATTLRDVLEAAVSGVADGGWEVTLDSPDVKVMADPLRLRRLLSTLLLSATAHAPSHVGIVAAVDGDAVTLSIGDDGPTDASGNDLPPSMDPDDAPSGVAHQLAVARQLADAMNGSVSWIRHAGVSLYTVTLGRADDVED